eukprot:tig00020629_g12412.t1
MDKVYGEYLEKSGVGAYVKDALTVLMECQPEDPIAFLADYFKQAAQPGPPNRISAAVRLIRLARPSAESFGETLAKTYEMLERPGPTLTAAWAGERPAGSPTGSAPAPPPPPPPGPSAAPTVLAGDVAKLVRALASDLPEETVQLILEAVRSPDRGAASAAAAAARAAAGARRRDEGASVPFASYALAIRLCLLHEEAAERAAALLRACAATAPASSSSSEGAGAGAVAGRQALLDALKRPAAGSFGDGEAALLRDLGSTQQANVGVLQLLVAVGRAMHPSLLAAAQASFGPHRPGPVPSPSKGPAAAR